MLWIPHNIKSLRQAPVELEMSKSAIRPNSLGLLGVHTKRLREAWHQIPGECTMVRPSVVLGPTAEHGSGLSWAPLLRHGFEI